MLEKILLNEEVDWAISTESMILKKVISRLPIISHHWIWLRFVKSHSSDDHSIRASLRHLRCLLVSLVFGSHLRFHLNDLSRIVCV